MRHELLLISGALLILVLELSVSGDRKKRISVYAPAIMGLITVAGFIPSESGTLFGSMYVTDAIRTTMKNILNLGVFLIFLQSSAWISSKENEKKISALKK